MSETIYDSDFTKYLPRPLTHDPKMVALAKAAAEKLLEISGAVENVLIYSRIDELPEELIDILAYDIHVDWYDYSYPLEIKREILKGSVKVHKRMGTKYAVEKALRAIYQKSRVKEWFEYGGEPGHFRVILNAGDNNLRLDIADMVKQINIYKRLSAHLDSIHIEKSKSTRVYVAVGKETLVKVRHKIEPYQKKVQKEARIGIASYKWMRVRIYYKCKG